MGRWLSEVDSMGTSQVSYSGRAPLSNKEYWLQKSLLYTTFFLWNLKQHLGIANVNSIRENYDMNLSLHSPVPESTHFDFCYEHMKLPYTQMENKEDPIPQWGLTVI